MPSKFVDEKDVIITNIPNGIEDLTDIKVGQTGFCLGYGGKDTWYVKCDCGKIFITRGRKLTGYKDRKPIQGCTECGDKRRGRNQRSELIGKKFGRLLVLELLDELRNNGALYLCQCDCGNLHKAPKFALKSGQSTSCGCYHREMSKKLFKETLARLYGDMKRENNPRWRHDLTQEERDNVRDRNESRRCSRETFFRDNYTCIICGSRKKLNAHHLDGIWRIETRYDINNLVTLCENCHLVFHNGWGRGYNTRAQFMQFYNHECPPKSNINVLNV